MSAAIIPLGPSPASTFLSLLPFTVAIGRCRARIEVPAVERAPDSNSLFLARPRRSLDKEKRLMKYYATRECMPAHALLSPFDQYPRKSPVPLPGGKMDRDPDDATLYRFDILSFAGHPLGPSRPADPSRRVVSIPYHALSLSPPSALSFSSSHWRSLAFHLFPPRASLSRPIIPYVWHAAASSSPWSSERGRITVGRLVFGTDHLATFVAGLALPWDRERGITRSTLPPDPAIRIRAAHEESSPGKWSSSLFLSFSLMTLGETIVSRRSPESRRPTIGHFIRNTMSKRLRLTVEESA